jgi:hypothetical protein
MPIDAKMAAAFILPQKKRATMYYNFYLGNKADRFKLIG